MPEVLFQSIRFRRHNSFAWSLWLKYYLAMHSPVTYSASVHQKRDNIFGWSLCQKYYLALGDRSAVQFE